MSLLNQKAPSFELLDQDGNTRRLSDYAGKKILLYFYPKDDTPGCTAEACSFRDSLNDLKQSDIQVIGVSCDSVASHKKFAEKFHLNFPLLADTDKKLVEAYGVWKQKSMFGKKYMGIQRDSFLIDENGVVVKHYEKVNPLTQVKHILKDIASMG